MAVTSGIKKRLLIKAYIGLIRLRNWATLTNLRTAIDLEKRLGTVLLLRVRLLVSEAGPYGADDRIDTIVHQAWYRLLYLNELDENGQLPESEGLSPETRAKFNANYKRFRADIDALVDLASRSDLVHSTLSEISRVRHFLYVQLKKTELAEFHLRRAQELEPDSTPIEPTEFRRRQRAAKATIGRLASEIADRGALKLDLSLRVVMAILTGASPFFVLGGYFYVTSLLWYFGIEAQLFFSLPAEAEETSRRSTRATASVVERHRERRPCHWRRRLPTTSTI